MRQKIISMIFCANQGFIVHSPRLRSLFATRPYSFIKHHAMNLLKCEIYTGKDGRNIYDIIDAFKETFEEFYKAEQRQE